MKFEEKNYYIDDRILNVKFSCDLDKCKGSCCTIKGAIGAPILGCEILEIKDLLDIVLKYIPEKNIKVIAKDGFYKNIGGELSLSNVNDEECVFSYNESGIAKCAFQKAYNNNEIGFKKPVSCELFPIRVAGKHYDNLRYEIFYECEDALKKGIEENTTIAEFVKDALIRRFGNEFYINLFKKQ